MNNYQWYLNGDTIFGANQFSFLPLHSGNYMVTYSDGNNCLLTSAPFYYEVVDVDEYKDSNELLRIVDILGVETKIDINKPLFYIYDNGIVKKRIIIK